MIKDDILKLQTYKMYEGEDTIYVERDDVLRLLERIETYDDDCISRKDAIYVANGYCAPANIAKELAKLPPIILARPKGKWLVGAKQGGVVIDYKCSECGWNWMKWKGFNYCPNCGADLREG